MGSTYADFTSANITGLMVRIIRKDFLPCVLQEIRHDLNIPIWPYFFGTVTR